MPCHVTSQVMPHVTSQVMSRHKSGHVTRHVKSHITNHVKSRHKSSHVTSLVTSPVESQVKSRQKSSHKSSHKSSQVGLFCWLFVRQVVWGAVVVMIVCSGVVYSIHHYVIKFVSGLRQVDGFLWVPRFLPPIKLTGKYNWNIGESGVKHHNRNHKFMAIFRLCFGTVPTVLFVLFLICDCIWAHYSAVTSFLCMVYCFIFFINIAKILFN